MKIVLPCFHCINPQDGSPVEVYPYDVEVREDGIYEFICRKGHPNRVRVPEEKYVILFEIGIYAIIDGYNREAVSSITSSLERFYEFYIHAVSRKHAIPSDELSAAWKAVKNQSERQLGSFVFLHLLYEKTAPTLLGSKQVEFRNSVIHKGYIPACAEAISYAESVLQLISATLEGMKVTLLPEMDAMFRERYGPPAQPGSNPLSCNVMGLSSMIAPNRLPPPHPVTVDERIKYVTEFKVRLKAAVEKG